MQTPAKIKIQQLERHVGIGSNLACNINFEGMFLAVSKTDGPDIRCHHGTEQRDFPSRHRRIGGRLQRISRLPRHLRPLAQCDAEPAILRAISISRECFWP